MKQLYIFIFFILSFQLYAQKERKIIKGTTLNDSLTIENVHVINKTSNKGTVTNSLGVFQISAKENDTILFSSIQYKNKTVIINKNHLKNNFIRVQLLQKTNKLQEVVIKQSNNMAKSLGLPNADKVPLNKLERKLNYYSQESLPIVILATLLGQQGGIDDIYNIISGNRKRDRNLKRLIDEDKKLEMTQEYMQRIREHFQDDFFINTLTIPKENINDFIKFCLPKDIINLFIKERFIEVIDIFIKNKEGYLNSNKN